MTSIEEFMLNLNEVFSLMIQNNHKVKLHQIFAWTSNENNNQLMYLAIATDYFNGELLKEVIEKGKKKMDELKSNVLEEITKNLIQDFEPKMIWELKTSILYFFFYLSDFLIKIFFLYFLTY